MTRSVTLAVPQSIEAAYLVILGHVAFNGLIHTMGPLQASGANAWQFDMRELALAVFILLAGTAASLVPAIRAARLDAGALLAKGA